jgi:hypothetical protein
MIPDDEAPTACQYYQQKALTYQNSSSELTLFSERVQYSTEMPLVHNKTKEVEITYYLC